MPASIEHLETLVSMDTTNPPRDADKIAMAIGYAQASLDEAGFDSSVTDLGDGRMNLLAVRGKPSTLVNCHLDTVPAAEGWAGDPFELRVQGGRAFGLGACDIKGAASAILAAAGQSDGDAAVLFTTDEEAGQSDCVRTFLSLTDQPSAFDSVIVCEPTGCRLVSEHRGLLTAEGMFSGTPGHASAGASASRSAVHDAVRWGAAALEWSARTKDDARLAIGVIEGGVKSNVVAESARVRFGIRSRAGVDPDAAMGELRSIAEDADVRWEERFRAPALAPSDRAGAIASMLGVECADPVDFWTEAALFAEAGLPSVVFGPGSIEQAHSASEFVPLADLERAAGCFTRLFSSSGADQ